jgi:hypothetical protein
MKPSHSYRRPFHSMAFCFAKHTLPCFNGLMASFSGSSRIFMDVRDPVLSRVSNFAVRSLM